MFRVFATRWWRSNPLGLDEDTVNDYEWRLGYLERFFGHRKGVTANHRLERRPGAAQRVGCDLWQRREAGSGPFVLALDRAGENPVAEPIGIAPASHRPTRHWTPD
jgi:hypothetical protein